MKYYPEIAEQVLMNIFTAVLFTVDSTVDYVSADCRSARIEYKRL